jgi:hypothetical protein
MVTPPRASARRDAREEGSEESSLSFCEWGRDQ